MGKLSGYKNFRRKLKKHPEVDSEINDKVRLYFFNPKKDKEEYRNMFGSSYLGKEPYTVYVYSPLYLARQDIRFCLGMRPKKSESFCNESTGGPANFIGIAHMYNTLEMVVNSMSGNKRKSDKKKFEESAMEVFLRHNLPKLTNRERNAFRLLRHAITHRQYGLKIEWDDPRNKKDKTPTTFNIFERSNFLIAEMPARENNYLFYVNVVKLYRVLEDTFKEVEFFLTNANQKYTRQRFHFSEKVRVKNWIRL